MFVYYIYNNMLFTFRLKCPYIRSVSLAAFHSQDRKRVQISRFYFFFFCSTVFQSVKHAINYRAADRDSTSIYKKKEKLLLDSIVQFGSWS